MRLTAGPWFSWNHLRAVDFFSELHIPDGVTPTFDDSVSGPVDIDSLTGGSLQFNSGTLNVAHTILLDHFTQDGGVFNGGGNFLANHAIINDARLNIRGNGGLRTFTQNSGMVGIDGNLDVTDFEKNGGGLRIGGSLDVTNSFYQSVPRGIDVTGEVRITHNDTSLIADNLPGHYVTMNDIVKPGPDAGKQTTSVTPSSASDSTQHPNIRYIEAQAAFLRNIVERLGPNWLQTVASWISGPIQVASISKTGSDSVAGESDTGRVDTPNSATTQEAADATKDVPQ